MFEKFGDLVKSPVTPLQIACAENRVFNVRTLIKQGADVNLATEHGFTPAMFACMNDSVDIVKELLQAGVQVNDANEVYRYELIHVAAGFNALQILKLLHSKGVDIDRPDTRSKATPLYYAAHYSQLKTTKWLLRHKACVNHRRDTGQPVLIEVVRKNFTDLANDLIGAGADVNAQDEDGWTSLMLAARRNFHGIMTNL